MVLYAYVCVCAFSLHRESPDRILGDKPLLFKGGGFCPSVGFERYEDKGEKSAPKFVTSSNYHKEEESLKPTRTHYPSNPMPCFNPKRGVKKNTPNPSEEVYICRLLG
jgi:hypothetical protein